MLSAPPLVIVAGMHRSGTSLVTRVLAEWGLFVGRPEHLMAADARSNPQGHWEVLRVARLNDDVLAACGAHWAGPSEVSDDQVAALADGPLGDDGREVLAHELADVEVVKDPRFCLTLPFWRRLLEDRVVLVVPWRHPDEVARSLSERNRFPAEHGRMLWDTYHRRLASGAVGLPRHLISHRRLVDEPTGALSLLRDFLDLRAGRSTPATAGPPMRRELVHHRVDTELEAVSAELLSRLAADHAPPPLTAGEQARRELVFGVAAALGNEHDRLRAIITGHPRREPAGDR